MPRENKHHGSTIKQSLLKCYKVNTMLKSMQPIPTVVVSTVSLEHTARMHKRRGNKMLELEEMEKEIYKLKREIRDLELDLSDCLEGEGRR